MNVRVWLRRIIGYLLVGAGQVIAASTLRYIRVTRQTGVRRQMNLRLGKVGSKGSLPLITATRYQSQCGSDLTTENACTAAS